MSENLRSAVASGGSLIGLLGDALATSKSPIARYFKIVQSAVDKLCSIEHQAKLHAFTSRRIEAGRLSQAPLPRSVDGGRVYSWHAARLPSLILQTCSVHRQL